MHFLLVANQVIIPVVEPGSVEHMLQLANQGLEALNQDAALAKGLNIQHHRLVHPAVQSVFPDLVA